MVMFKNKHILVALIVAPILAIGAYYLTDYVVAEKPHVVREGQVYQLIARSSCRYKSGRCIMSNGNFKVILQASLSDNNSRQLTLDSVHPLEGVKLAIVSAGASNRAKSQQTSPVRSDMFPVDMLQDNSERTRWTLPMPQFDVSQGVLRLAVAAGGATYYGETETLFVDYQTIFEKDFRDVQ